MPHEAGLSIAKPFPLTIAPMPMKDACHILAGAVYLERGLFFFLHRQGGGLRLAHSSLPPDDTWGLAVASQQALAFEGSAMRANACRSPVTHAARSPVTSPTHLTCAVSRAGPHERIVPGTRSARSANRTRGVQHVELHTRARMRTRPFQIHTALAIYILAVHAAGSYPTWSILAPDCDRADARVQALREMCYGPRTRHRANPARLPN